MSLEIYRNKYKLDYKSFVFPGGEINIKLNIKNSTSYIAKTGFFAPFNHQNIIAKLKSSDDILELVMVVDALERIDDTPIKLIMPYVPYGRQDRVCDAGESFSLKAFTQIINGLNFKEVVVVDPHSYVTESVLNNVKSITQLNIINKWTDFIGRVSKGVRFVSPDAGANKKTADVASFFNHTSFIRADKLRDLSNGNILETIVYSDDLKGKDVVCCDDICDGGRTYIELAKALKTKNVGKFILFVTHGIFSKGVDILFNSGIDEIWTTNSWSSDNSRINVFNLDEKFEFSN